MMNQNSELIRRIQLKELEILKVFQEICKRHNLRYFAIGGTCLGAVRHKGFIPWDDDVDVAMPYEDYEKFLEVADSELPEGYETFTPFNQKGDLHEYLSKIHNINTALIEAPCLKDKSAYRYWGIYIDIFMVHGMPTSKKEFRRLSRAVSFYGKLSRRLRMPMSDEQSLKGLVKYMLSFLLQHLGLPYDYFTQKSYNLIKNYPLGCSDKIIFPWRKSKRDKNGWYTNIFPYRDFRNTVELPFEDTTITIPAGYDDYLRIEFGDYMTLPPEEKRNNHMSYGGGGIVDLDRSYKYYAAQKEAGKLCL